MYDFISGSVDSVWSLLSCFCWNLNLSCVLNCLKYFVCFVFFFIFFFSFNVFYHFSQMLWYHFFYKFFFFFVVVAFTFSFCCRFTYILQSLDEIHLVYLSHVAFTSFFAIIFSSISVCCLSYSFRLVSFRSHRFHIAKMLLFHLLLPPIIIIIIRMLGIADSFRFILY